MSVLLDLLNFFITISQELFDFARKRASILISILALLFTASSFWWLNARTGRLKCFAPRTFSAYLSLQVSVFRFPLVFHNTGPQPIIIEDLRLKFFGANEGTIPWGSTRTTLKPSTNEEDKADLPAIFYVQGRTASQFYIEFHGSFPGNKPTASMYEVEIQALLGHRKKWKKLISFPLHLDHVKHPGNYISYSNDPTSVTAQDRKEASEAFKKFG